MNNIDFKIKHYSHLLKNKNIALQQPDISDEEKDKIIKAFDEEIKKPHINIDDFMSLVKTCLDVFDDISDEFIESIKQLDEPEFDTAVNNFVSSIMLFRSSLTQSLGRETDYPSKIEVIDILTSLEFDQKYINHVDKFYRTELSSQDIIKSFL